MRTVGSYEAKTHFPELLTQVQNGATITITKSGKPVARLVPATQEPVRDIRQVVAEFRAYSKGRAESHGTLTRQEIKAMTEEGRP